MGGSQRFLVRRSPTFRTGGTGGTGGTGVVGQVGLVGVWIVQISKNVNVIQFY